MRDKIGTEDSKEDIASILRFEDISSENRIPPAFTLVSC
jgi:hypothetical protein